MSNENHYDVIIIGTGAGGGTLARKLAPTGKRILLLERGDYVPREKDNWSTRAVNVQGKYQTKEVWRDRDGKELHPHTNYCVGGNTKFYGAALFRLRAEDFCDGQASRRHLAGLADLLRRAGALLHAGRAASITCTASAAKIRPSRPSSGPYPYPAVSHEPRIQQLSDDFARARTRALSTRRWACMLDEKNPHASKCIRCNTCDGFPCLVYAKVRRAGAAASIRRWSIRTSR